MIPSEQSTAGTIRAPARTKTGARITTPLRLLLVEDSDADAQLFKALIQTTEFLPSPKVTRAHCITEALQLLTAEKFDCVLLDMGLPDAAGLSGLNALRSADPHAAILMLTGLDDDETALEALRNGAQDYLVKDQANDRSLGRAILRAIQRHQLLTELAGEKRDALYHATHDALTGLANRRLFDERLAGLCASDEPASCHWNVVLLDLDGFKAINDNDGHAAGDEILREVARRLRSSIRGDDMAARIGGDELVLLIQTDRSGSADSEYIQRLRAVIEEPIQVGSQWRTISASIGVARHPADGTEPAELLAEADRRMYANKQERRSR